MLSNEVPLEIPLCVTIYTYLWIKAQYYTFIYLFIYLSEKYASEMICHSMETGK